MAADQLSLDAKVIAASNIAVAKAIWGTHYAKQPGQQVTSSESNVNGDFTQAMKQLDELVKQVAADAPSKPKQKAGAAGF